MRWWLRLLTGSVLAAAVVATPVPAPAATLDASGWWNRFAPAPPPPGVPDDGLYVQGTPEGATAVAAVRYTLSAEETDPILELTEVPLGDDGSSPPSPPSPPGDVPAPPPEAEPAAQPVLLACRAGSSWTAAQAGAWDDRPEATCDARSVRGRRSEDGTTWTFPLGAIQVGMTIDVVLVPGTVAELPEGVNGSTFEIAFAPPDDNAMNTTASVRPFTDNSPRGAESFDPASPPAAVPPGEEFVPSPPVAVDAAPVDIGLGAGSQPEPPLPEPDQDLSGSAPPIRSSGPVPGSSDLEEDNNLARGFAAVVLVLGAGLVLAASRQAPRPVHSLSRLVRTEPPGT